MYEYILVRCLKALYSVYITHRKQGSHQAKLLLNCRSCEESSYWLPNNPGLDRSVHVDRSVETPHFNLSCQDIAGEGL